MTRGTLLLCCLLAACGGPEPMQFETTPVERGEIVSRVTASGTASALVTVQVGSQVSGRIQELFADFNSPVQKGQLVARIDPRLFQSAVEQASASLAAARGRLLGAEARAADARRRAERARGLAEQALVSQAELDGLESELSVALAEVDAAKAAVEQARANLRQAELSLAYTEILSPIDGVVISRNVDVGQTVAASFQAPVLFTIAEDLSRMQVEAAISEADVGRLAEGGRATFTVDAWPESTFEGTIRQIRNAPQVQQNVVTYTVVIDVANPDMKLRPGMTANVTIEVERREDVLVIPNTALHYRPPDAQGRGKARRKEGTRTVWVLEGETPSPVVIETGASDGVHTEVRGGELAEGALVVTDTSGGGKAGKGGKGGKSASSSPFGPAQRGGKGMR